MNEEITHKFFFGAQMLLALLKKEFYLRWHAGQVLKSIMGGDNV